MSLRQVARCMRNERAMADRANWNRAPSVRDRRSNRSRIASIRGGSVMAVVMTKMSPGERAPPGAVRARLRSPSHQLSPIASIPATIGVAARPPPPHRDASVPACGLNACGRLIARKPSIRRRLRCNVRHSGWLANISRRVWSARRRSLSNVRAVSDGFRGDCLVDYENCETHGGGDSSSCGVAAGFGPSSNVR